MARKNEENHNQFFDSEAMLMDGFLRNMAKSGMDISVDDTSAASTGQASEPFFVTQRPTKKPDESKKIKTIGNTRPSRTVKAESEVDDPSTGYMSMEFLSELSDLVDDLKSHSVFVFEKYADSDSVADDAEKMVRLIEKIQRHTGVEYDKFQPLKHKSGLKSRDKLENTNMVVSNTVQNYQAFPIVQIQAAEDSGRPAVFIVAVGESNNIGFTVTGVISAKSDFTGAEAIDYVHEVGKGGIMSVKTNRNGRWVDVSDDFIIKLRYEENDLNSLDGYSCSMFLGENIIDKQDFLVKEANLDVEDVKFGKIQVFANDSQTLDRIRKVICVKPE